MNADFNALTHPGIRLLKPYIPGKTIEEVAKEEGLREVIKLASNENPWGCSPCVANALNQLSLRNYALYPIAQQHPLCEQLANHLQVTPDMITLSNGSDMLIYLLMTCFASNQPKHMMTHQYAFMAFTIQANILGIPSIITPTKNWYPDIDAMIQASNQHTALIFIANPGNPTGVCTPINDLLRLLENIPKTTLLVLDEAYYEYAKTHGMAESIPLLEKYPNLVILRTFSKAYGLAGLRLGYAIAHPEITALLYRIQLPFAVNIAALTAAAAALTDQDFIYQTVNKTKIGLQFLQKELEKLDIQHTPSSANFVTMHSNEPASKLAQRFQKEGIVIRPLEAYDMQQSLRVTVGTEAENKRFIEVYRQIKDKK